MTSLTVDGVDSRAGASYIVAADGQPTEMAWLNMRFVKMRSRMVVGQIEPYPAMLFLHTGWAREYRGDPDDLPQGKFGYIAQGHSDMGDALNFKIYRGRYYGYAPHHTVDLTKLGGERSASYVDGVLVVWTATNPDGSGRYIVGWYKNARVYREMQNVGPRRKIPGIIAEALAADCHSVPVDERTFFIPSMVPGWPGIKSAYYPGDRLTDKQKDVLLTYVGGTPSLGFYNKASSVPPKGAMGTSTPEDRKEVEEAAVKVVLAHYEANNWTVERVDTENQGWDLNVTRGSRQHLVEVKGRGGEGAVTLTPNEFRKMQDLKLRMKYRLAIVFDALKRSPKLTIFYYAPGKNAWVSDQDDILSLQEAMSAIASF